jgi:hypothetical protein
MATFRSCSKCGTFHILRVEDLSDNISLKIGRLCRNCSWNQGSVKSFSPVNFAAKSGTSKFTLNIIRNLIIELML